MSGAPAVEPDTKNWTWVLERRCPECGFVSGEVAVDQLAGVVRHNAAAWQAVLASAGATVRSVPTVWSALEYACHVRDVHGVFDDRLRLMLTEDEPHFANWDQDETAVSGRYGEQDAGVVAIELLDAAEVVARRYESVPPGAWGRRGIRSDGSVFSVESLGRYHLHDIVHHVWDVSERR